MRPARLLLALLLLWAVAGAFVLVTERPMAQWLYLGGVLAVIAAADAIALWRQPTPQVQRHLPDAVSLGVQCEAVLTLDSYQRMRVDVFDLVPEAWTSSGMPRTLTLPAASQTRLRYALTAHQRGDFRFAGTYLRLYSRWRLWRQLRTAPTAHTVRVYPDFAPLARLALFSAEQASRLVGAHIQRRRGEGTDFHQMRDYRVGDSLRQIDWKATARARKLISRDYQDEKNQQVVLLLDRGRRMLAHEDGLSHFDHVLNAALVVSYLALRQGDAVGMFAPGQDKRWVAPRRGMGALDLLLRASYDLQPEPVATDYLAAASELALRQRRRSLVMLVSNVRDEDMDELLGAVRLLEKRHLVCVASLRERELDDALCNDVDSLDDAVQAGAIALYLQQRQRAHDALRSHRVMVLDVTAEQLPGALVERYLSVKREGLL